MTTEPLLDIAGLVVRFGPVRAVDGVSLQLPPGPYGLALVGESGSGKTTIGRAALRLVNAVGGTIRFEGKIVTGLRGRALKDYRRAAQIVFQDPDNSLDPRMRVGASIAEALAAHRIATGRRARERAGALLAEVGLDPAFVVRYPHQLSGGSGSASPLPGRCRCSRGCLSSTSPPAPSTSGHRRRSCG